MKALLLSALIAVSALPLFAQELVYRSNSFGMLLERIEPYRRDQSDWIMGVSRAGAKEIRRLYSKGKEVRRWEVSVSADGTQRIERELARDVLAARRIYDAGGNLLQEDEYTAGRLAQKSMFTYRGNRLARMRLLKADGSIVYTEQYVYGTSGALLEVRRTEPGGGVRLSSYVFGPAGLTEERNATRDVTFVARYDTRGRLASREQRRGDATLSREDFTYRADSDHLQSSLVTLPGRNEQVVRHYDEEGRLVSENRRASGELAEEIAYTRDEKGRMTGKSRRTPAGLETWKYTLDGDGKTMREEFYRRGLLERVTIYGEGNRRTEDYYRDDSVFLKVYYDGDQRLSEEVFEGGRMVRERHYR
jgi:antitoxin component YwqK of YwqJK toxin-antitoxin module